ncbi:ABC-2 type transport system permease protein [Bacillus oleivorans]|uniref:ABC-2 type transport system permease protein n=1 Tax=Bacillus oleivorans TaxID=1448271 RepID=A0A285CSJ9_9BACI|nr:ABC transporter permease [Bacillus oleivorans]SNX70018.1 ABC-2 type transport system permease protein [Bacillus oleivorans]
MNSQKLWNERFQGHLKDYQKYLRYMFNDHLLIVLLFVIAGGALQYQAWLQTIEADFPAAVILAVILPLLITRSRTATFLHEADQAFLLPAETRMRTYFWRSGIYSFIIQSIALMVLLFVLFPMYSQVDGLQSYITILLFILVLKAMNLWLRWMVMKERGAVRTYSPIVRYLVNATVLYFYLEAEYIFTIILFIILVILITVVYTNTRNKLLKWDELIQDDTQRTYQFYRFANMFTDVPKLKSRVKRRRILDFLLPAKTVKNNGYLYLFSRTYVRYGDYFGLTIRLSVIGFLVSFLLETEWSMLAATFITIYLTGFQLVPLFKQNAHLLWVRLYPVQAKVRIQSFIRFLTTVLLVQLIILSSVFLLHQKWVFFAISVIAGYLFIFFFMKHYIEKRIQKG